MVRAFVVKLSNAAPPLEEMVSGNTIMLSDPSIIIRHASVMRAPSTAALLGSVVMPKQGLSSTGGGGVDEGITAKNSSRGGKKSKATSSGMSFNHVRHGLDSLFGKVVVKQSSVSSDSVEVRHSLMQQLVIGLQDVSYPVLKVSKRGKM